MKRYCFFATFQVLLLPVLVWYCIGNKSYAQHKLQGNVRDTLGNPLPFVNLALQDSVSKLIWSYCISNSEGKYVMETVKSGSCFLLASSIGYESLRIPLQLVSKQSNQIIIRDLILHSKPFFLPQVNIETQAPIIIKGDTVIMNTEAFTNGSEKVVEDILKKLPGVSIDAKGGISVNGKAVSSVMIEGDDLFDNSYQLLTKTLGADLVEKVELINKFSQNKLLKGVENSDEVAINLKLDKGRVSALFGSTDLATGTESSFNSRINLISIIKRLKLYALGAFSNIGKSVEGDVVYDYTSGNSRPGASETNVEHDLIHLYIQPLSSYTLPVESERYTFNNVKLGSINGIYSPLSHLKLKAAFTGILDKQKMQGENQEFFFLEKETILMKESFFQTRDIFKGLVSLQADYERSASSAFAYQGKIGLQRNIYQNLLHYDSNTISESIKDKLVDSVTFQSHLLTFTQKLKPQLVWINTMFLQFNTSPQQYISNTYLFEDLFMIPKQEVQGIDQQIRSNTKFYSFQSRIIYKKDRLYIDSRLNLEHTQNELYTHINLLDNNWISNRILSDNFSNDFNIRRSVANFESRLNYKISPNLSFLTEFPFQISSSAISNSSFDEKQAVLIASPILGIKWEVFKDHVIIARYNRNPQLNSKNDVYHGFIISNYREFSRGLNRFHNLDSDILSVNYTYGGWQKKYLLNLSALYISSPQYISFRNEYKSEYSLSEMIFLEGIKNRLVLIGSWDRFIRSMSCNVKLNWHFFNTKYEKLINSSNLNRVNINNSAYGFELRSAFSGIFNFHLGARLNHNLAKTFNRISNSSGNTFVDFFLTPTRTWGIVMKNEVIAFKSENITQKVYVFSDITCKYDPGKGIFEYGLYVKNLLNTESFTFISNSDLSLSSRNQRLLPRYILGELSFRF